jgi:hypothetical protein
MLLGMQKVEIFLTNTPRDSKASKQINENDNPGDG